MNQIGTIGNFHTGHTNNWTDRNIIAIKCYKSEINTLFFLSCILQILHVNVKNDYTALGYAPKLKILIFKKNLNFNLLKYKA